MGILIKDSFTDIDGTYLQNHTPEIGSWDAGYGGQSAILNNSITPGSGGEGRPANVSSSHNSYAQCKLYTPVSWSQRDAYLKLMINGIVYADADSIEVKIESRFDAYDYGQSYITLNGVFLCYLTLYTPGDLFKIQRDGATVYVYQNGNLMGSGASRGTLYTFHLSYAAAGEPNNYIDDYEAGEATPPTPASFALSGVATVSMVGFLVQIISRAFAITGTAIVSMIGFLWRTTPKYTFGFDRMKKWI